MLARLFVRLKAARVSRQLTQEELRTRAELPYDNRLSLWEREQDLHRLTVSELFRICSVLEMPAKQFFEDAFDLPKYCLPPDPGDPNYIVDPDEKILLASFRNLKGKERRMVMLLATEIVTLRDRRFEVGARSRRHNWAAPEQYKKQVTPEEKAAANVWLRNHAEQYVGKWVAFRAGIPIDTDTEKDLLTERLVGQINVLLMDLRDLKRIRFEGFCYRPKRRGAPATAQPPLPFPGAERSEPASSPADGSPGDNLGAAGDAGGIAPVRKETRGWPSGKRKPMPVPAPTPAAEEDEAEEDEAEEGPPEALGGDLG
jgi:transcriptional regulator with XRE-family HTH domain